MSRQANPPPLDSRPVPPPERVTRAADAGGLGAHERTVRVHRDHDGRALVNGIACAVAAVLLIVVPAVIGLGPPFTIVLAIAAVVLVLVPALEVPIIVQVRRIGPAWAHLFDHGIVLERATAGILALPAATSSAHHVTWQESGDGGTTRRTALILAPADGPPVMLEARGRREGPVLAEIAARYGQPTTPVEVDQSDPTVKTGHW